MFNINYLVPLIAALALAGCGGGGSDSPSAAKALPGIAVGEPNPSAPAPIDLQPFRAKAQLEACADTRNRLAVIDGSHVFWERRGNCGDNSYAYRLYGATPDKLLCSQLDSIAGPQTSCTDDTARALFKRILDSRKGLDIDLGKDSKVSFYDVLAVDGTRLPFKPLMTESDVAIRQFKTLVLRDNASMESFWAEYSHGRLPMKKPSAVNFDVEMVIAVLPGEGACFADIHRVGVENGKLEVMWRQQDPRIDCIAMIHAPMMMVTVPRSDAEVVFKQFQFNGLERTEIFKGYSNNWNPAQLVVRDAKAWQEVWQSHLNGLQVVGANAPPAVLPPAVDFSKHMVIVLFSGGIPVGCGHSIAISDVAQAGERIAVGILHGIPVTDGVCPAAFASYAEFVQVPRSDAPVEFYPSR